jgi:PKD repeat protein
VNENSLLTVNVTANDPDAQAITSLTATGTAITAGATFAAGAGNTSGQLTWTPTSTQSGSYAVTFTATNTLSGSASTAITVGNQNQNPIVTAPATASVDEGSLLSFVVSATDADGDDVTLSAPILPLGASFTDGGAGSMTGTFSWTPGFNQAGPYSVTFNGSDGNGGSGSASTSITVNNVNRAPTANANGPYNGVIGINIAFSSAGSSDPDGDALTYAWDFGDLSGSTQPNPSHAYAAAGVFNVTLTVSDPSLLSDTDPTTATISDVFGASAFAVGGNTKTSLGAGKPYTCFQVQSSDGAFDNSEVNLSSIKLYYGALFISVAPGKASLDGDKNGDNIPEISACFSKTDLRILFAGLPAGNNTVTVHIEGDLTAGGHFRSDDFSHIVKGTGGALAAQISPNPLNPKATLTFATTKPGLVKVTMYDLQGRLVKQIADNQFVPAGYHDFSIDGTNATGGRVASGVYFVKVWTEHNGSEVQRITVLK